MHTGSMFSLLLVLAFLGMMIGTVNTGISAALRRPQTFHRLIFELGNRLLVPLSTSAVLIGTKSSAGTATAATVYTVSDPEEGDTLFGAGSELALMCRKAFETAAKLGAGPALYAVCLGEPGAGVASAETLTITGPATADGNLIVRIAGRWITVGVANGQSAATIAAALKSAIDAQKKFLPVTAGIGGAVVTCTHVTKGTNGNDTTFTVEKLPAGVGCALAHSVTGTGTVDIQTALDAIAGQDFDAVAIANHQSADITEINAQVDAVWAAAEKRWRYFFLGEFGSIGTATTLASGANREGVLVVNCEGTPSLTGEIATAAMMGSLSRSRPNAIFNSLRLPLYAPPIALVFTGSEVETALNAGITPLSPVKNGNVISDGELKIERLITTRTTLNSVPFSVTMDLGISRGAIYVARQLDVNYTLRFGADANPDGVLDDAQTQDQIRDMVNNVMGALVDTRVVRDWSTDRAKLVIEADAAAVGRENVDVSYKVVAGLHQAAFVHHVST